MKPSLSLNYSTCSIEGIISQGGLNWSAASMGLNIKWQTA